MWRFTQSGCNPSRTPQPYTGIIASDASVIYTDPNILQVIGCGGLIPGFRGPTNNGGISKRGNRKNPLDSGSIVIINGVGRNLKIQYLQNCWEYVRDQAY